MNWRAIGLFAAGMVVAFIIGSAYLSLTRKEPTSTDLRPAFVTPVANLKAVTGVAPTLVLSSPAWPSYSNTALDLTLRYPPGWKYVQQPQDSGVKLYPPESDPDLPSPLISFSFAKQQPFNPQPTSSPYTTQPQQVRVAGISGQQYEDTAYAVPTQGSYIELPYHGGTLLITATKGPNVNLAPQLQEILKTLVLKP